MAEEKEKETDAAAPEDEEEEEDRKLIKVPFFGNSLLSSFLFSLKELWLPEKAMLREKRKKGLEASKSTYFCFIYIIQPS